MFSVGDKVVHPMHGAGVIQCIVTEKIGGVEKSFYAFEMPVSGLTLKVPVENSDAIGLRAVLPMGMIDDVLRSIPALNIDSTGNWNQRYRENMERIKSGDIHVVAGVVKSLMLRESERGLSNGERKMLHSAKQILVSEVVLAEDLSYAEAEEKVNTVMLAKELV